MYLSSFDLKLFLGVFSILLNIALIFSILIESSFFNLAAINKLFNTLSLKLCNLSLLFNALSIKLSLSLSFSLSLPLSSSLLTFLLSSLSFSLLSFLQPFLLTSHIQLLPINFNKSSLRFLNSFFSIALSNNSLIPFTNSNLSSIILL